MRRRLAFLLLVPFLFVAIVAIVGASSCSDNSSPSTEEQRLDSVKHRSKVFAQAEDRFPLPRPQNFPLRQALVEYTDRQDLLNHPWYIYILGVNGNPIGYFVGRTYPQNICNFLSSTEEVRGNTNGTVVLTAPSLDGIYYGGGGAVGTCDAWFFFDVATNAMQVISGLPFFVSDAPLALNVQPIKVEVR